MTDLLGRMVSAAETEGDKIVKDGIREDGAAVVVEANKADKVSRARSRMTLRRSLNDKRNVEDLEMGDDAAFAAPAAEGEEPQYRGPAVPESVKKALEEIQQLAKELGIKEEAEAQAAASAPSKPEQ